MKRYLFVVLLFFACTGAYAQSLSFEDMLNLTSMGNGPLRDMLTVSKGFKVAGTMTFNGKTYQQFTKITKGTPDKNEAVLVGTDVKTASGVLTHEIIYNTSQQQELDILLTQAKKSNLSLVFQGADLNSNIYRFDNSLFRASISLAFDKKSGNVDVQEK